MKYDILHRTHYTYLSPARESFNDIRLEPPSIPEQTVESYSLRVEPEARVNRYTDFYSTLVHHFEIPGEHNSLLIESRARVETHAPQPLPDDAKLCPMDDLADAVHAERCFDFLQSSRFVELDVELWKIGLDEMGAQQDVWQAALALMRFTHGYLTYLPNSTHVNTHVSDVIQKRCGVCQDYAHFLIGLCRSMKIPARYVSGYLATEIASATHAWTEVYIPHVGWRALDPTHNCQAGDTYVKIGHGRDYADVPPVSGNYHGTLERTMSVGVKITQIREPGQEPPAPTNETEMLKRREDDAAGQKQSQSQG
ncbi:MAG TPA: transglutaminase family protein [Verrucomicrobiae bacterium]|jgi:transglutaminase-like putative cysteine protease